MLNSERVNNAAKNFAAKVAAQHEGLDAQINYAFQQALGRIPSDQEMETLITLSNDLTQQYKISRSSLLHRICLILLNLNETIYLD
jgi:hypothetical protein